MSPCPFCDDVRGGQPCGTCGRAPDPDLSRRPCPACQQMTPLNEPACCHCGQTIRSELRWKVPVIILMFVVAIAVSVLVQVFGR